MAEDKIKKIEILGVPFNILTWEQSLTIFEALLLAGHQYQIAKANPEFVMTAQTDHEDMEILQGSAMNLPDGIGILWAAAYLSLPPGGKLKTIADFVRTALWVVFKPAKLKAVFPERIGGEEHVVDECRIAAKHGMAVFLLGASDRSREKAAAYLTSEIPALKIAGNAGSFNPDKEADWLVDEVNKSGAQFLIVCFGHPLQEKWIHKNLKRMPNIRVADGEGGAFDYMAKIQKRAPKWLQKISLEWLWRLLTQRKRSKKIWVSVPKFASAVYKAKLAKSRYESKIAR